VCCNVLQCVEMCCSAPYVSAASLRLNVEVQVSCVAVQCVPVQCVPVR